MARQPAILLALHFARHNTGRGDCTHCVCSGEFKPATTPAAATPAFDRCRTSCSSDQRKPAATPSCETLVPLLTPPHLLQLRVQRRHLRVPLPQPRVQLLQRPALVAQRSRQLAAQVGHLSDGRERRKMETIWAAGKRGKNITINAIWCTCRGIKRGEDIIERCHMMHVPRKREHRAEQRDTVSCTQCRKHVCPVAHRCLFVTVHVNASSGPCHHAPLRLSPPDRAAAPAVAPPWS